MRAAIVLTLCIGCAASSAPSMPDQPTGTSDAGTPMPPPAENDGGSSPQDDAPLSPIGPAGDVAKHVTIDGVARSYQLHVPSSATTAMQNGNVPLLVGLHGAGDTGDNFITATLLKQTADQDAFVLLGPDAYDGGGGGAWFLHDNEGWPNGSNSLSNDVSFILRMLADTASAYRIDTKRMFVCGFSRGAGFTGGWAILSDNAQLAKAANINVESPFAAYGVSAGFDMFGGQIDASQSSPKRPMWIMHGTADQAVPFSMGQTLSQSMQKAGFTTTFTPIQNAPHGWMWRSQYGHTNQELWDWFMMNPLP
jgi:poly(3-hydroxybutyrate) depolymerase